MTRTASDHGQASDFPGIFTTRDRYGEPIPHHRTDLTTRAQVLAALSLPHNPDLDAAAIAEEEAMIAEQAALDQAASPTE